MVKKKLKKNIVLFVSGAPADEVSAYKKKHPEHRLALIYNKNAPNQLNKEQEVFDIVLPVNFDSPHSIIEALTPYFDELLAATSRSEAKMFEFIKLIPFLSYLRTPTAQSLEWSIDKIPMRRRFFSFNKKITPKFTIAKDSTKETIARIVKRVGFPLILKPSGLAVSLLVSICYHEEELISTLKSAFRKIKKLHKEYKETTVPGLIAEEFMDGDMYSIDGYVNSRGKVYYCPMVSVQTGRSIGFDDFFGYKQITPTNLGKKSIEAAQEVATEAVHALGLRSTTLHIELMKTEAGWKIIEVGARVGGFRADLYRLSFGIDHTDNDIRIRIPQIPVIPKKVLGHTAAMKFFAPKEGRISAIKGAKKARELSSFHSITINKKVGDRAVFAKNGGRSVFNIILHNENRSRLLADIRRLEKMVHITVG